MTMELLDSADIAQIVFSVATPNAIYNILRNHEAVIKVRQHLLKSMDAQQEIESFVRDRLFDLKAKKYFPHEPAFCALAVVVDPIPNSVATDFLKKLAALKISEMPISFRVAKLCLLRRRELHISNTTKVFEFNPLPIPDKPSLKKENIVLTESTYSPILKAA